MIFHSHSDLTFDEDADGFHYKFDPFKQIRAPSRDEKQYDVSEIQGIQGVESRCIGVEHNVLIESFHRLQLHLRVWVSTKIELHHIKEVV